MLLYGHKVFVRIETLELRRHFAAWLRRIDVPVIELRVFERESSMRVKFVSIEFAYNFRSGNLVPKENNPITLQDHFSFGTPFTVWDV